MSAQVMKPILVAIFLVVVVAAAVIFGVTGSPQASEITPSASPPTSSSTISNTYTAPYPGMAECSDGQDNDGDGQIDWSQTPSDTADPQCASARDRSEKLSGTQ